MTRAHAVVPAPASVQLDAAGTFVVDTTTEILIDADAPAAVEDVARRLAALLAPSVAPGAPRRLVAGATPPPRAIHLRIDPSRAALGPEGYELTIAADRATLVAREAAGLFYGVQTIRQLLPVSVEHPAARGRDLRMRTGRIVDVPRFEWRGAMLDVARHFLPADDVRRYIDAMALYKLNRLHLHLADDQGWRIEILSWPKLATVSGSTEVGGGAGGYYTQREYAELVAYAAERHVTIVPEIDVPGHTNAALVAYPELNCDGRTPTPYTGIEVGFSTLCVERDSVYRFVDDVVREIGALTPGAWFHIGGDEVEKLTHEQYLRFVERVEGIVRARGKRMIGWGEVSPARLDPTTVVQHWKADSSAVHAARGGRVILSPSPRVYLDMKYDSATVLGLRWAGLIDLRHSYDWDPATQIPGVAESAILGVEAPLWSETLVKLEDFEQMAFPRLAAVAEVAWSPAGARRWDDFRLRLGAHGARMAAIGLNYYRSPQVEWAR
jgi:hexosaminidase